MGILIIGVIALVKLRYYFDREFIERLRGYGGEWGASRLKEHKR